VAPFPFLVLNNIPPPLNYVFVEGQGDMSRELAPPMVMRHMERSKEPLPSIAHTPIRHSTAINSDESPKSLSDSGSPSVVGSIAVARRHQLRHCTSPMLRDASGSPDAVANQDVDSLARSTSPLNQLHPLDLHDVAKVVFPCDGDGGVLDLNPASYVAAPKARSRLRPLESSELSAVGASLLHYNKSNSPSLKN
jgi:hypothetical protein